MDCATCAEFAEAREIRTPGELSSAIDWAWQGLSRGVLVERKCPVEAYQSNTPFVELAKGGPWDDGLEYHFACTACAQEFVLYAETYHGRGGAWSKIEDMPGYGHPPVYPKPDKPSWLAIFVILAIVLIAALTYYAKSNA